MRSMPRFAATAVTTALALAVLGMPGVALAGGPDASGARGAAAGEPGPGPASGVAADAPGRAAAVRATPTALPTPAALPFVGPRAQEAAAAPQAQAPHARQAKATHAQPSAGRPAKAAAVARPATPATPAAGKAARTTAKPATAPTAKADPRGNNGTFKVDGPVLDTSHGNEPHVSCAFRLNFFGYDAGQLGRISLTAIAPTAGPTTRVDGLPLISTSSAKGGQYDGSYPGTGTLTAGDLGLDPTVAHHVKVSVESVDADGSEVPGGAKHKVFWLEPCATAAAPAGVPVSAAGSAPVAAPRSVRPAAAPAAPAAAPIAGEPGSAVLGATVSAQAARPVTVLAVPELTFAQGAAQPETLAFTGSPQLLLLLMLGVVTLAGGGALLVAVRRVA